MENELLAPLFLIIIGLLVGAVLKFSLRKTQLPYTVGLFVFGIIVGLLNRAGLLTSVPILEVSIDAAGSASPDAILYIFLPILIFDAAYSLDTHIFKKTLLNATILSVPGVIIAMFLTAAVVMGLSYIIPGYEAWSWTTALMFGALISATDPVAVVALLKELGASKRFSTLVDAESMLNDGTGIVLFMLFFKPSGASPYVDFIRVVIGGALLGFIVARFCIYFITNVYNSEAIVQISIIVLMAYVVFLASEIYLNVSGVIALVVFGLSMTYFGNPKFRPGVTKFMKEFWELASFIANTLIFIIVGVVIASNVHHFNLLDVVVLIAVYVGINLIRAAMVFFFFPIMKHSGYGMSFRESVILSWGGLRGAVGLTLALMVASSAFPESIRQQLLFMTAGIVALTLSINATTVRWLLTKLGLNKEASAKLLLDYSVKSKLRENAEKYVEGLKKRDALETANWTIVDDFLPAKEKYEYQAVQTTDILADLRLRILNNEKSIYWNLYNEGVISEQTLKKLTESADDAFDENGLTPLSERCNIFHFTHQSRISKIFKKMKFGTGLIDQRFHKRVVEGYDLARGWLIVQKNSQKFVEEFSSSDTLSSNERECLPTLAAEVQASISAADNFVNIVATDYPKSYKFAVTQKAIRMLLRNETHTIEQFMQQGLLSADEAEQMQNIVSNKYKMVTFSYIKHKEKTTKGTN